MPLDNAAVTGELKRADTLEQLYPLLNKLNLMAGWNKPEPSLWAEPKKNFVPAHWRYEDAKIALDAAVTAIGRKATGVQGDAANLADLDRLYDTVKREKGRIDVLGRNVAHRSPQLSDTITGEPVVDPGPLATGGYKAGARKRLEMMRRVRDGLTDVGGDHVDAALTLGEHVDDLGPATARQCLGDLGECIEQRIFGGSVAHRARSSPARAAPP